MIYLKENYKNIIFSSIFLFTGFIFGHFFATGDIVCNLKKLDFINKELACDGKILISKYGYASLKGNLNDFIKKEKEE